MDIHEALNKALTALDQIDHVVETIGNSEPLIAVDDIGEIIGDVIGELARAGFESKKPA